MRFSQRHRRRVEEHAGDVHYDHEILEIEQVGCPGLDRDVFYDSAGFHKRRIGCRRCHIAVQHIYTGLHAVHVPFGSRAEYGFVFGLEKIQRGEFCNKFLELG